MADAAKNLYHKYLQILRGVIQTVLNYLLGMTVFS